MSAGLWLVAWSGKVLHHLDASDEQVQALAQDATLPAVLWSCDRPAKRARHPRGREMWHLRCLECCRRTGVAWDVGVWNGGGDL